jgi:hypothetical protein
MKHLSGSIVPSAEQQKAIDCKADPIASLTQMFVRMVQQGRIAKGQCPVMRPVFLKPHGVLHGVFRIAPNLPSNLKIGLFAGTEYPAWVRFSSDTLPTISDYKTTVGIGIKLFNTPTPKIFGLPDETTFDFILQNFDVFFVNTAKDMCEFTKAGVVDGDYRPYLKKHPETATLLDEMAKPVASVLGIDYWSGVPFAFGPDRYVKYKLEPQTHTDALPGSPPDPTYLAADLERRLKEGDVRFRFAVQFRADPAKMPLDEATVRWSEVDSPPVHIADLILPQQDSAARGQAQYGENLSWNIWRVTEDHRPQGSIADARRIVYAASADLRRNVNGVPTGEPVQPKPALESPLCVDQVIVRAAIYPGIGIARIGDSASEFFIGPEVADPPPQLPNYYRDSTGALKREAARFRIYGFNANGDVVRELTSQNADIEWTVHLANRKAQWYQFQAALDIPDAVNMSVPLRNASVVGDARASLAIDPGERSISGASVLGGVEHRFDTGKFQGVSVPLGEIQTDDAGRLLVLGGHGKSASPSDAPIYIPSDPNSFNNASDWYDDISDGPVTASVSIDGRSVPVEAAWVVVAPPNYAPGIVGWRTMYELLVDVYVQCGWMAMPEEVSFNNDILPVLRRLSNLQWVNKAFATMFGRACPMDFENPEFIARLAQQPDRATKTDPYMELRQVVFNCFRPTNTAVNEPRTWPWIYGDAFGSFSSSSPGNNLPLPSVQQVLLKRWVEGDFLNDWNPSGVLPNTIDQVPLAEQPSMLTKSALHFCLADAFHPGCEMTWPMRHPSMYEAPFRIRQRPSGPERTYGARLTQQIALAPGGPLYAQGPGDISRWMALPWQGDTAFCRSGYDPDYDPYLPTFWPARVPNQVLSQEDYEKVMDDSVPREERIIAFNHRPSWLRALKGSVAEEMKQMVAHFGAMGIVEARPGLKNDPDFPETIYVETLAGSRLRAQALQATRLLQEQPAPPTRVQRAGWESQEQFEEFRSVRVRHT